MARNYISEDVSDKRIMDSYIGVLRISPSTNPDYGDGLEGGTNTRVVTDSIGNQSQLSLSTTTTEFTKHIYFNDTKWTGSITGTIDAGQVYAGNFYINTQTKDRYTAHDNVVLTFRSGGGIDVTSTPNDGDVFTPIVSYSPEHFGTHKFTDLAGFIQTPSNENPARCTISFGTTNGKNGSKTPYKESYTDSTAQPEVSYYIKDSYYESMKPKTTEIKVTHPKKRQIMVGNPEPFTPCEEVVQYEDLHKMVWQEIREYFDRHNVWSQFVPVGTIVYITLPAYEFFKVSLDKVSEITGKPYEGFDTNDNAGYTYQGAVSRAEALISQAYGDVGRATECVVSENAFALRLPSEYSGYWDFCLGQDSMFGADPYNRYYSASGGVMSWQVDNDGSYKSVDGDIHTKYNNKNFPELFRVLNPIGASYNTNDTVSFRIPNLQYNFIQCAAANDEGREQEVVTYNGAVRHVSSSDSAKIPTTVYRANDGSTELVIYPCISQQDNMGYVGYTISDKFQGAMQIPDYDRTSWLSLVSIGTTSDPDFYTHVWPWVSGGAHVATDYYDMRGCCLYSPRYNARFRRIFLDIGGMAQFVRFKNNLSDLDNNNWTENKPRHSVLIPIIKVRSTTFFPGEAEPSPVKYGRIPSGLVVQHGVSNPDADYDKCWNSEDRTS